jgi:N-acetylglucosamine kinase-like BadF-type ATPase
VIDPGDVVLVGVDAGASKAVALAVRLDGSVVGRAEGEGANPKRHGLDVAAGRITGLARMAGRQGSPPSLVYIAGAGIDRPEQARTMEHEVESRLSGTRVMAANDTLAVLRCGTPDGVGLVVPGSTGGNVIGRGPDGRVTDRGHGIFGGGYVLGALAARAAIHGRLSPRLAAAIDQADLAWTGRRPEPLVAQLAEAVLAAAEAGDPYPARIVERWCGRVTDAVREEVERLVLGSAPAVIVYGGLVEHSPWLEERLRVAILDGAPDVRVHRLVQPPVTGAALLARDAWAGRLGVWDFTPRR